MPEALLVEQGLLAVARLREAAAPEPAVGPGDPRWMRDRATAERSAWKALDALQKGRRAAPAPEPPTPPVAFEPAPIPPPAPEPMVAPARRLDLPIPARPDRPLPGASAAAIAAEARPSRRHRRAPAAGRR